VRAVTKVLIACSLGGGALFACADIFGIHGGTLDDSGAGDGAIVDAPYDYVTHDAIDLDVNTAVCDGGIPIVADNLAAWVSQKHGNDMGGCGVKASPCASIGFALAHTSINVIYLDDSMFNEALALDGGQANFTIQGGFVFDPDAGTWTPNCNTNLTTIQGPADAGSSAVDIMGANGITFRLVTIQSKVNGASGTGESVYAVRVFDTPGVTLDNVTLLAQSGGAGAVGMTGTSEINCNQFVGNLGGVGTTGDAGALGQILMGGFSPQVGGGGGAGQEGTWTPPTAGASGSCWSCN
jgi:hypothetical protein